MITNWCYGPHHSKIQEVKEIISSNNFTSIDVGAAAYHWSYPECKTVVDLVPYSFRGETDISRFTLNLDVESDLKKLELYAWEHGKFDFSICSHTLEDLMFPMRVIESLQKISKRGYIAVPSKYREFVRMNSQPFYGWPHHKQLFDVIDDKLVMFPKFTFIEYDERTNLVSESESHQCHDLILFWEDTIPTSYFGEGVVYASETELQLNYYKQLALSSWK